MARFEVRFLKDVCNDTGHARSVLQRTVRLEAEDEPGARRKACDLFCAEENIGHWRDHADRMDILQVDWSEWQGS